MCVQAGGRQRGGAQAEQQLYTAVSSSSSWLDHVENALFSGSVLLTENPETLLQKQEVCYCIQIYFLMSSEAQGSNLTLFYNCTVFIFYVFKSISFH